jgi:hypothetical protein
VKPGGGSRGLQGARTIIFIVVIAAAVAVAAWSLIKTNRTEADVRLEKQYEEKFALERLSGADFVSSYSLDNVAPDEDFAFVLLAGADPQETMTATLAIEQSSGTLAERGIKAAAITIGRDDPDFERVVDALQVETLPAVVLVGRGCGPSLVAGDITENELLKGYVMATCVPGCGPDGCAEGRAASGCCPGQ